MESNNFVLKTQDGLTLHGITWKPDGTPKAGILLVHGIGEHIGRYLHVAEVLTNAGYELMAFDLRGHGKSEGIRGHAPSYGLLMDDINRGISIMHENLPGLPIFLYGHSLGGNLALYYSVTQSNHLTGLIATSPALGVTVPIPPAKMFVGKIMYKVFPSFLMKNGLDTNDLSRDPKVGSAYTNDPLVHPYTSARLGLDLINSGKFIIDNAKNVHFPILLMQGTSDKLVSPALTHEFAIQARADLVTYKEWPGYYHELHNEPDKDEVFKTILDWINAKLP